LKRWPLTRCSLKEIVWPDDFADASAMMGPELVQLRRAANTGQRSASRAA